MRWLKRRRPAGSGNREFDRSVALNELEKVRESAAAAMREVQDDVEIRVRSGELTLQEAADLMEQSGRHQILRVSDAEQAAGSRLQNDADHPHHGQA